MKKLMFFFAFCSLALVSCSQDIPSNQVPSVVLNSFQQKYPQASDIEWEKQMGGYKVEFEIGKTDYEVWYETNGKLHKEKQELSYAMLPVAVQDAIKKQFSSYMIDDVDKITLDEKVTYRIELKNNLEKRQVTFDEKGTVLDNMPDFD